MLEYRPFEPKCAKNTLYCCYSLIKTVIFVASGMAGSGVIPVNRTFSGDCYYCVVDGYIDAGPSACEETGPDRLLPEQHYRE